MPCPPERLDRCQTFPPHAAAVGENPTSAFSGHAAHKTMLALPPDLGRLVLAFHALLNLTSRAVLRTHRTPLTLSLTSAEPERIPTKRGVSSGAIGQIVNNLVEDKAIDSHS